MATGLEIFALTAQSHSMEDVNIWPVGTWVEALPIGANCTESLESQLGLIFVVCVFFNSLLFCVTVRGCQKPGGAEGFQQCLPGGFLSRRQMGVCWARQLHYRETDPGSPVSTARSQLALGVRGIACPSPTDYKHPPPPMWIWLSHPSNRYHCRCESNSEQEHSKDETWDTQSLGFRAPFYCNIGLPSIRLVAKARQRQKLALIALENLQGSLWLAHQRSRFGQHQSEIQQMLQIAYPKGEHSRLQNLWRQTPLFFSLLLFCI